jgi:hypothetical protein
VWCAFALLAALGLCGSSAIASTIVAQNDDADQGNYGGGFWVLSDVGFAVTNGPLTQTTYLQAVTFKSSGPTGATNDDLYLKVFDDTLSFVGISTNTINPTLIADTDNLTWTFNNLSLDKDSGYAYVVGTGNDSTLSNQNARIKVSASVPPDGPIALGGLISATTYDQVDPTYDPAVNSISLGTPGTILGQPQHADNGAYAGASWALSDSGFASAGLPLAQALYLESVRFERGSDTGGTSGDLYLKVFTEANEFVGISSNTVDQLSLSTGDVMDWTFDGLVLDKDTTYRYFFSTLNDSNLYNETARISLSNSTGPLAASLFNSSYSLVDAGYNPTIHVVVTPVPEPTSIFLAAIGLLGVVCCTRSQKRKS